MCSWCIAGLWWYAATFPVLKRAPCPPLAQSLGARTFAGYASRKESETCLALTSGSRRPGFSCVRHNSLAVQEAIERLRAQIGAILGEDALLEEETEQFLDRLGAGAPVAELMEMIWMRIGARLARAGLAAGLCLAMIAGCGSEPPAIPSASPPTTPSPTPSPSPSPSPTATLDPTQAEILATVQGYHDGYDYMLQHPESGEMWRIQQWTVGEAFKGAVRGVGIWRQEGKVQQGSTVIRDMEFGEPAEGANGEQTVTVAYCIDATNTLVIPAGGAARPPKYPTIRETGTLVLEKDKWWLSMGRNMVDGKIQPCCGGLGGSLGQRR